MRSLLGPEMVIVVEVDLAVPYIEAPPRWCSEEGMASDRVRRGGSNFLCVVAIIAPGSNIRRPGSTIRPIYKGK